MKITGIIIVTFVVLIIIADVILVSLYGLNSTISWWMWVQAHNWPAIPFSFGVLMGHFFFSQPHLPPESEHSKALHYQINRDKK